jgi:hypothetical protein
MKRHESDVCVIGGGISAAMLAEKMSELKPGVSITIVEAGKTIFDLENRAKYRERFAAYGENPWPDDFIEDQAAKGIVSRTMAVGGSALHWGGTCNRFSGEDLRLQMTREPSAARYRGNLTSRRVRVAANIMSPAEADLSAAFTIDGTRVTLSPMRIGVGRSRLDLDGDRDLDIIVINKEPPHDVWINDRMWQYHPASNLDQFMNGLRKRNPGEPEYHQAVQEVVVDIIVMEDSSVYSRQLTAALAPNGINVPVNFTPRGGLKVVTDFGWFAVRPSGTEEVYKLYAESFRDEKHLQTIVSEAQHIVDNALARK